MQKLGFRVLIKFCINDLAHLSISLIGTNRMLIYSLGLLFFTVLVNHFQLENQP